MTCILALAALIALALGVTGSATAQGSRWTATIASGSSSGRRL